MRLSFDEIFEDQTKLGTKIQTSEYHESGTHIIIDQGQDQIAGYTDRVEGLFSEVPAIIFGDHTRAVKYVDKPFFLGADGVKVLRCKLPGANYRYLYYALRHAKIPNTGYNRHFKWLKEVQIPYPDTKQQEEIVTVLDNTSRIIETRQRQLRTLDTLIKARFVEMFGECDELVPAGTIMSEMRNGISPSTSGQHHERVLTLSAITQGRFDPNMWKDGVFDTEPPTEKRISADDFYMCRGNGNKSLVGAGVYSSEDRRDLVFPDTVIAARVDTARVCLPYLFVAWMQPDVRNQIETGARTTNGTYKINQQVISKIKIPLPPLAQQKQFAAFVSQVDKSKAVVQAGLDKVQLLFDSLMQQYFG